MLEIRGILHCHMSRWDRYVLRPRIWMETSRSGTVPHIGPYIRDDDGGITLLQSHYVEKVLSRFGYIDCKPSPTPYDPSVLLRKNKHIARDQLRYSQIIGSLMYLASATRPDISFDVSKLSRFVSNPGD